MLFALMSSLRRATVDLQTWQDAGKNRKGVGRGKKFWTAQNFSPRTITGGTRGKDVQHTWNTRDNPCSGSDQNVNKTWQDAVRRESLGVCHGQSTVIGRVVRVVITGNSVCLAAYHWQMDFPVLRQCLGGASAVEQPTTVIPRTKHGEAQTWPKITTYDHVHQICITFCTWFRRWVLCDRGFKTVLSYIKIRLTYNVRRFRLII